MENGFACKLEHVVGLIRTRLRLKIPQVLKHLPSLTNLVHHGVVSCHELTTCLVVGPDAMHYTRKRALSEVIAHEVIQLWGDDAQTLLACVNGSIQVTGELHAPLIQRICAVHDALSERHGARVVMLHSPEHVLLLRDH